MVDAEDAYAVDSGISTGHCLQLEDDISTAQHHSLSFFASILPGVGLYFHSFRYPE